MKADPSSRWTARIQQSGMDRRALFRYTIQDLRAAFLGLDGLLFRPFFLRFEEIPVYPASKELWRYLNGMTKNGGFYDNSCLLTNTSTATSPLSWVCF